MAVGGGLCRKSHCRGSTRLAQDIEQLAALEQGAGCLVSAVLHLDEPELRQVLKVAGMPAISGTLIAEDDGPGRDLPLRLEPRGQVAEKAPVDLLAQGLRQVAGLGKAGPGAKIRQRRKTDATLAGR